MCRRAIMLSASILLSGCAEGLFPDKVPTSEQLQAKAKFDATMAEQVRQQESKKCQSFGAKPGTDAYIQCMTNLSVADAQAATAAQQRRQDEKRRKMEALGRALQAPPNLDCTTNTIGNTSVTHCN